eukprot:9471851-Pyramimonas_sp.AAC.1
MADARIRGRTATMSMILLCNNICAVLPEPDEEDEIMHEAIKRVDRDNALCAAEDLPDDVVLEGDGAIAIYANQSAARQYLHNRKLGRGNPKAAERENANENALDMPDRSGGLKVSG